MQGDINAITGTDEDSIQPDKFEQESEEGDYLELPPRNSEDKGHIDIRGEELLELCRSLNLLILNGRKTGDPWGKITSYQWNGTAVVDYVIISSDIFSKITHFKVGDYSPWVSDHCPLLFEIKIAKSFKPTEKEALDELPKSFYLEPEDRQSFIETLESHAFNKKLETLDREGNSLSPQELTSKVTELLLETCEEAGVKPKTTKNLFKCSESWFDVECKRLKSSIKKKCKELRANLKDESLRKSILTANNLFKKLVKRKKEEYKREIIQNTNTKKGNQELYWKLLDKLQMRKKDVFKSHIPGSKWNEYFKIILINQQEPTLPQDFQDNGPLDYLITEEELEKASYILKPNKSNGYDCLE